MDEIQDILIAEDDIDDFEVLQDVLKNLSLKLIVNRAENGDILMKVIHEKVPDMLFLDLVLPCKNGKTCIQEIRADKKFDNLPIIVYSTVRDPDSIEFCFRAGSNLYVHKPDTYSGIIEAIRKIFSVNWKTMRYYPSRAEFVLNPDHPGKYFSG
jgi:CheY-like chemotaxis protein